MVEALQVGVGHEAEQVPVPPLVPGQDGEVPVVLIVLAGGPVEAGAGGHVRLDPEDGLDAPRPRLLVEVQGSEHDPVVGEPHGRHAQLLGLLEDAGGSRLGGDGDAGEAVEEGELGVRVKMDEALPHVRQYRPPSRLRRLPRGARPVWKTCGLMTPL